MAALRPRLSPVAWVTVEKVTQQILWLILFAVLAPILGPKPYGLFSIVMVFVGICEFVLLEGAVEAMVTVEDLAPLHTTTANLANGLIAVVLTAAILLLAPFMGPVFGDPELKPLMWALAPLPLLSSLSATPIAVLRRSLNYRSLAIRSIAGLLLGGTFGIVLAVAGYGVWALAGQVLAQRAAEFLIVWISAPVRIGFQWSGAHFRDLGPVGMNVLGGRVMNAIGGQLPRVILGYMLGPTDLGLFTLAVRFQEIIVQTAVQPLSAVARIELRAEKPGSAPFEQMFRVVAQNVSLLSFPVFVGAAAVTPEIFRVWLDQRWSAGVLPMQLILLSGVPLAIFYCIDAAFFAANLSNMFARAATVQAVTISATVLCSGGLGLDATCAALAIRPWILLPFFLAALRGSCHLTIWKAMRSPTICLIGAAAMGAVLNLPFLHPAWMHQLPTLVLLVALGSALYVTYLYCFLWTQFKALLGGVFIDRV